MKKVLKILFIILLVWLVIFVVDFISIKISRKPIFMINTKTYGDKEIEEYRGFGYKVFIYNVKEDGKVVDDSIHIMTYFKKYSPKVTDKIDDNIKFSKEYTTVDEDNVFKYKNIEETIKILKNGTGVVFIGFKECPWCQKYVPMLNKAAMEVGIEEIYYLNIYNERKENTEEYKEIVTILSDYLQYDDEGNKRVYVPAVVAILNGKIVGFDDETSLDTNGISDPDEYWSETRTKALSKKLVDMIKKVTKKASTSCNS